MKNKVAVYYDMLADDNNDPVFDPEPLREYMNKWDGQGFIERMKLNKSKSVLEIGVGTGRLAVQTAPLCGTFFGIDISPKTVEKAKKNLAEYKNVNLRCCDFINDSIEGIFDVIYSSLTFMHFAEKQRAIDKAASLLKNGGRFLLSIDKNTEKRIDYGTVSLDIYPDDPEDTEDYLKITGFSIVERYETEFAVIFVSEK